MSIIRLEDAQAWAERTKLPLSNLEDDLVSQIATQVLSRIAQAFDTTGWTTDANTPDIVRSIISMKYVAWLYRKTYSEDEQSSAYADQLDAMAETLIEGIVGGVVDIIGVDPGLGVDTTPLYYPNDLSSAQEATVLDPSLGPARFTMGTVF